MATKIIYHANCMDGFVAALAAYECFGNNAYTTDVECLLIPTANSPVLISEVGNKLCQGHPYSMVYFDKDNMHHVSLRSDEHGLDVSEIAKTYGGGGHKHAAGFITSLRD